MLLYCFLTQTNSTTISIRTVEHMQSMSYMLLGYIHSHHYHSDQQMPTFNLERTLGHQMLKILGNFVATSRASTCGFCPKMLRHNIYTALPHTQVTPLGHCAVVSLCQLNFLHISGTFGELQPLSWPQLFQIKIVK